MSTIYEDRVLPAPNPNPGDEAFFEATGQGKLMVRKCNGCGKPHWYPRHQCPFCMSHDLTWVQAGGGGSIYSFSVTRRGGQPPFAIAYVTLDEGVSMMTNIVDCDLDDIRIGQRVKVVFKDAKGDFKVPCFTLDGNAKAKN